MMVIMTRRMMVMMVMVMIMINRDLSFGFFYGIPDLLKYILKVSVFCAYD